MGQLIAFPLPLAPYPDLAADLDTAERALLDAIRWWVESYREGDDPIPRLCQDLHAAGAPDAAFSIDGLMTVAAKTATHSVEIHCPHCPNLSSDEKHLLRAASLAQAAEGHLAEKALRTALLSAQGAKFAISSLESLSQMFLQARLFLSRRRPPAEDRSYPAAAEDQLTGDIRLLSPPRSLH